MGSFGSILLRSLSSGIRDTEIAERRNRSDAAIETKRLEAYISVKPDRRVGLPEIISDAKPEVTGIVNAKIVRIMENGLLSNTFLVMKPHSSFVTDVEGLRVIINGPRAKKPKAALPAMKGPGGRKGLDFFAPGRRRAARAIGTIANASQIVSQRWFTAGWRGLEISSVRRAVSASEFNVPGAKLKANVRKVT